MTTAVDGKFEEPGDEAVQATDPELDDMPQRRLTQATFDEIVDELRCRFKGFVLMGNLHTEHDDYDGDCKMVRHGGMTLAMGYATRLKHVLMSSDEWE